MKTFNTPNNTYKTYYCDMYSGNIYNLPGTPLIFSNSLIILLACSSEGHEIMPFFLLRSSAMKPMVNRLSQVKGTELNLAPILLKINLLNELYSFSSVKPALSSRSFPSTTNRLKLFFLTPHNCILMGLELWRRVFPLNFEKCCGSFGNIV